MLSRPLRMLKRGLVISLLVLLLCPLNSRAQDICFDDATAGRMVVALEQARISDSQLEAFNGSSQELIQQKEILQGTIKLLQDQIATYKSMQEMTAKMDDMKDKACAEQVKAATPTFTQNMGKYSTGAIVGAILTALAILAL